MEKSSKVWNQALVCLLWLLTLCINLKRFSSEDWSYWAETNICIFGKIKGKNSSRKRW